MYCLFDEEGKPKPNKKLNAEELKKYGDIQISCVCGKIYYSPRNQTPKCEKCGHIWNLAPTIGILE